MRPAGTRAPDRGREEQRADAAPPSARSWIAQKKSEDASFFDKLGTTHKPEVPPRPGACPHTAPAEGAAGWRGWRRASAGWRPATGLKRGSMWVVQIMWIGCVDSRVAANEIIGKEPGDVFVHR